MKNYTDFTDEQLLEAMRKEKDDDALFYLLETKYRPMILKIRRELLSMNNWKDDDFTEKYCIVTLYVYLYDGDGKKEPFAIFNNVKDVRKFPGWLKQTCYHRLLQEVENLKGKVKFSQEYDIEKHGDIEDKPTSKPNIYQTVKFLESVNSVYSPEDRLIYFNYLAGKVTGKKSGTRDGKILSAKEMAAFLDIKDNAYRTRKSRLLAASRMDFKKYMKNKENEVL